MQAPNISKDYFLFVRKCCLWEGWGWLPLAPRLAAENSVLTSYVQKCVYFTGYLATYKCQNEDCGKELTSYHKHWLCRNKHMICRDCYMDLTEQSFHKGTKPKCPCCDEIFEKLVQKTFFREHAFLYVDDSNMWIEAKKLAAKQLNLKCVEDPRVRLDLGKVSDVVASGREVAWGVLYGSEPPPIDSVWEKIRQRGWKVKTSKRSRVTNKEKQVDHQILADITALVSDKSVAKGKIVIVSGDADVIPAIKEGLTKKWSFEIWMWEKSISKKLKDLEKENPKLLTISPLDSHLDNVTFTNFKFRAKMTSSLNFRSVVIRNCDFCPDEEWQRDLSAKLRWPFQFNWIGLEELASPVDYEDIVLIFANLVKPTDNKGFASHFDKIFESLQQEYPGKVVLYSAYREDQSSKKEEICLTNKFVALEDLEDIDKVLSLQVTSDEDKAEALDQEDLGETDTDHESQTFEDNQEPFQVVKRKGRKRTQQYSEQCKFRSKCVKGLNCTHKHTEDEKKFFKKPRKNRACRFKNRCTYGPSNCDFAHVAEDSFCQKCHQWGHLQDECTSKLS